MMKSFFKLCFLSLFFAKTGFGADSFGRFVGTLKHDRLQKEQLAKIDFVAHRQTGSSLELMAVLTLQFGEFTSGEYVSYHFDSVRYDISTSTLVFDQADQDVSLVVERFDGNNLTASLRHVSGGNVGKISLVRDGIAHPTQPLIQPLWGEYRGSCESPYGESDRMVIRLKTSRSSADSSRVGNPFGSYDIRGSVGSIDLCNSVESAAGEGKVRPLSKAFAYPDDLSSFLASSS